MSALNENVSIDDAFAVFLEKKDTLKSLPIMRTAVQNKEV